MDSDKQCQYGLGDIFYYDHEAGNIKVDLRKPEDSLKKELSAALNQRTYLRE